MERKFKLYLFLLALLIFLLPAGAVFANSGDLKVGDRGEKVSQLQSMLKGEGLFPSGQRITGYFGPITYNSVVALEKKKAADAEAKIETLEKSLANFN